MKRQFYITLFFIYFLSNWSFASHIVGGEIQFYVVDKTINKYFLGLNLYFDAANGRPAAETATITLYFFRKSDNVSIGNVTLPQTVKKYVNYTNPNCIINNDLSTYFISYGTELVINSSSFSDPAGYYIVWERCCRNSIVTNIVNPSTTGATFYLSFPALFKDNQQVVNSSPKTSVLTGDYICLNRPFKFDFSAKDPDGDSLVYSLVNPYAGFANSNNPEPVPRGSSAYPEVVWANSINLKNVIPGSLPLQIDRKTGVLQVTAGQLGLFVFAVMIEEYRKGVKIGIVRREFQLKVVDCPKNDPPVTMFKETGKNNFYKKGDVVFIKQNQSKCLDILITDTEANQRLSISTKALNFDDKSLTITPAVFTTRSSKDTLKAQVCFASCIESINNLPIVFEVIVQDDGCPQPLADTLNIRVIIEPTNQQKPDVNTDLVGNQATEAFGSTLKFNVIGTVPNNGEFLLEAKGRGFELASAGMSFVNVSSKGKVTQPFTWVPTCISTQNTFFVDFIITSLGCGIQLKDTVTVQLKTVSKPNSKPKVTTSLTTQNIVLEAGKEIVFDVYGDDQDKEAISLIGVGKGFRFADYGMSFTNKSGVPILTSQFVWNPECSVIQKIAGKETVLYFIVEDKSCTSNRFDTTVVQIKLELPQSTDIKNPIANVITPNGDGKNDCFSINPQSFKICESEFKFVEIINRWGRALFKSESIDFRWCAEEVVAGTYFYLIQYSDKAIKGTLSVLR